VSELQPEIILFIGIPTACNIPGGSIKILRHIVGLIELYYGLFIGGAMILGSWTGKQIIQKLSKTTFTIIVEILLIISGIQLVWSSF
jgi:uncharacterized membrane protein YfcA